METKFRTKYSPPKRVALSFLDENGEYQPGKTEQCHKDLCDMTNIIKQFDKTGLISHVNKAAAQYGDFTEVNEYKVNLEMIQAAQIAFEELPSAIRKKFGNNPGNFFEFATDPKNQEELVKLGLAFKIEKTGPTPVIITNPPETEEVKTDEK